MYVEHAGLPAARSAWRRGGKGEGQSRPERGVCGEREREGEMESRKERARGTGALSWVFVCGCGALVAQGKPLEIQSSCPPHRRGRRSIDRPVGREAHLRCQRRAHYKCPPCHVRYRTPCSCSTLLSLAGTHTHTHTHSCLARRRLWPPRPSSLPGVILPTWHSSARMAANK